MSRSDQSLSLTQPNRAGGRVNTLRTTGYVTGSFYSMFYPRSISISFSVPSSRCRFYLEQRSKTCSKGVEFQCSSFRFASGVLPDQFICAIIAAVPLRPCTLHHRLKVTPERAVPTCLVISRLHWVERWLDGKGRGMKCITLKQRHPCSVIQFDHGVLIVRLILSDTLFLQPAYPPTV